VCVLLTAIVLIADGRDLLVSRVLVNLTMLQSAFGVPHVDGVYWTLWVEMRFYALMAVFILVGITKNRIICFAVLWPVVGAIAETTHLDIVAYLLVWQHAALFGGGMLLFVIVRTGHSLVVWLALAADVLMAFASSAPELAGRISSTTGSGIPSVAAWGGVLLCFALVALVTLTPLRRVRWRWLSVSGALTYPLYLLHEQIGWSVIRHAEQFGWVNATLLATAVSLALAIAVHQLVERRGGPALRRALRKGFDSPTTELPADDAGPAQVSARHRER
jgi:peptidoglycan/LPS O-acetylase OafA/YrhL